MTKNEYDHDFTAMYSLIFDDVSENKILLNKIKIDQLQLPIVFFLCLLKYLFLRQKIIGYSLFQLQFTNQSTTLFLNE